MRRKKKENVNDSSHVLSHHVGPAAPVDSTVTMRNSKELNVNKPRKTPVMKWTVKLILLCVVISSSAESVQRMDAFSSVIHNTNTI
jgi:hypothetical protein